MRNFNGSALSALQVRKGAEGAETVLWYRSRRFRGGILMPFKVA
jgi:hypothetical protein